MAIVADGIGDVQAAVGVFVGGPFASEFGGWKEPSTEWLMKATVGLGTQEACPPPLGPGGRRWAVLAEAV